MFALTWRSVTSTEPALISPVLSLVNRGKDWSQNASVSATSSRAAVIRRRWNVSGPVPACGRPNVNECWATSWRLSSSRRWTSASRTSDASRRPVAYSWILATRSGAPRNASMVRSFSSSERLASPRIIPR